MNLKFNWYLRNDVLSLISTLYSATFFVLMMMVIRYMKFVHYGLGMYPGIQIPKGGVTITQAVQYFDKTSIDPLVFWGLPIAVLVDVIIIRPLARKFMK